MELMRSHSPSSSTPMYSIGMEKQCGKVDYRLQRLGTLPTVIRSIILKRSQQLRDGQNPSFRGYTG